MTLEVAIGLALWLVVLVALALLFARTARRMTRLAAQTRELTSFQAALGDLATRTAGAVDPVILRLDEIRRRTGDPARVAATLPDAMDIIRAATVDATALRPPRGLEDHAGAVRAELERIERALDLIDHGLTGLVGVRGPRELEIQTTLKRGALNLRHARDGVAAVAADVAGIRPSDVRDGVVRTSFAARPAPVPVWRQPSTDPGADGGPDPSM